MSRSPHPSGVGPRPDERAWLAWLAANPEPPDFVKVGMSGLTKAEINARVAWLQARNEAVARGDIPARGGYFDEPDED